jgi:branched-chain amino acid transport system ATP-binding protein
MPDAPKKPILELRGVEVHYGGVRALGGISLQVAEGSVVALIGANGAGKTTTLKAICGLVRPRNGEILFKGRNLTDLPTEKIVASGISLVPEGRRVFPNLTVLENLMLGAYSRADREAIMTDLEWVYQLFPRLRDRRSQKAGTLSGGEQQMLAIGRGLMARPELLLMDEPSLGLAPKLVEEVFHVIEQIHREGKAILLVEQNARLALSLADYAYVLETGRIAVEGPGRQLLTDDDVRKAYLGVEG